MYIYMYIYIYIYIYISGWLLRRPVGQACWRFTRHCFTTVSPYHVQSYTVSLTRPLRTLPYIYVYIYYTYVCSMNTYIGMYMYTC